MEISYGLVNLMYFMLCGELSRIKGSRSNKRRQLLTCFTNSLFKVYNNLSLRETGPEVYNTTPPPRSDSIPMLDINISPQIIQETVKDMERQGTKVRMYQKYLQKQASEDQE